MNKRKMDMVLCKADVMTAFEHWLNNVILKNPVKVTDVKNDKTNMQEHFIVTVEKTEDSEKSE